MGNGHLNVTTSPVAKGRAMGGLSVSPIFAGGPTRLSPFFQGLALTSFTDASAAGHGMPRSMPMLPPSLMLFPPTGQAGPGGQPCLLQPKSGELANEYLDGPTASVG